MAYLNYTAGFIAQEDQKLKGRLINDVEVAKTLTLNA